MDVDRDQRGHRRALEFGQFAAHHVDDVAQLPVGLLRVLPQTLGSALDDSRGHLSGPVHLRSRDHHLTGPLEHPLLARFLSVLDDGSLRHLVHRVLHHVLELEHPLLHRARLRRVDLLAQRHLFALDGDHRSHGNLLRELHLAHRLEALLHERLHAEGILRLGENLQELVVGQEEKTGKRQFLQVQEIVQSLLHHVQLAVGIFEILEKVRDVRRADRRGLGANVLDDSPPRRVHVFERRALLGNLLHNLLAPEDGLQVQPLGLALEPLIHDVLQPRQLRLPRDDAIDVRFGEGRRAHCLRLDDVVVQQRLGLVDRSPLEDARARLFPRLEPELQPLPVHQHLV